ncbi:class I adenylate-forming enzyme family protein [Kitasatospora sp. NPDC087314]|uniref:class I adenylate-forming enzyme family protein n=1 Tax=Kitasatospora sp. NPDC087314 TaxID=3364068 RepID=UPI00381C0446
MAEPAAAAPAVAVPAGSEPVGPLDGLLAAAAADRPDHPAIVCGERSTTFAELDARADILAAALRAVLPGAGQVVAVAALLDPDFAAAYYGTVRAGHTVATVNPLLREDDLVYVLGHGRARFALVDAGLYARLAGVRDRLPDLLGVAVIGPAPAGLPHADQLPAGPAPAPRRSEPDAVACLHFTSGTTGRPKAVRLTHRNLVLNAGQVAAAHRLDGDSVTVNHLPTYHPMHLNSAVRAGATQVLCPAPDEAAAVEEANRRRATHFYSLPFRLARLAADERLPGLKLETVRRIASGGSALSPAHAARLTEHFGVTVFQGYGLAETSPLTHSDDPDAPLHGSVGRPVPGTEHRVVEVTTRTVLPVGEVGEVQVRGPQVMKGYLGGPDGHGLEPDGWFSTGDVGRIDEQGRLTLVDRLKDVFKYHNWLVSPSEIERVLIRRPEVRDCVVFDHADGPDGSVPHALLVLAPSADPVAVCREVNAGLPYFQRIRYAHAVPAIERSANGKLQRRELRERHTGRDGAVPAA